MAAINPIILMLLLWNYAADHNVILSEAMGSSRQGQGQGQHCSSGRPLFVFGASMVDVGENAEAMPWRSRAEFPPYGLDYSFPGRRPNSRRFSNGRLIIDFISEGLGNNYSDPYLTAFRGVGATKSMSCGANFASSGSKARNSTLSSSDASSSLGLFCLGVQVDQFAQFRDDVVSLADPNDESFPSLEDFSNAIYFMEIGHNDYTSFVDDSDSYDIEDNVNTTITFMKDSLKKLHLLGAINIVVMNVIPLGCTPIMLGIKNPTLEEQDEYGCFTAFNDLVKVHNSHLEATLQDLTDEFPNANWTLFDAHSIFMAAIQDPNKYGIQHTLQACCGVGGDYNFNINILCGKEGYINGTLARAWRCDDPSSYIFWDTLHPVESFANIVANGFLSGEYVKVFTASSQDLSSNLR